MIRNHKYYRKWTRLGIGLFIIFGTAMLAWEAIGWINYVDKEPGGLLVWLHTPEYPDLTKEITNFPDMFMWTFGNTLPFFVSTQLWICFVVFTVMLSDSVHAFVQNLKHDLDCVSGEPGVVALRNKRVGQLIREYEAIADFNDCLNDTMGLTFWLLYYLDLFTVLGQVAGYATGSAGETRFELFEDIFGSVIWLLFMVVMMWPCVAAHETVFELLHCLFLVDNYPFFQAQEIPKIIYVHLVNSIPHLDSPEVLCCSQHILYRRSYLRALFVLPLSFIFDNEV